MQAIEFEAQLEGGVIHLPEPYRNWREGLEGQYTHPARAAALGLDACWFRIGST